MRVKLLLYEYGTSHTIFATIKLIFKSSESLRAMLPLKGLLFYEFALHHSITIFETIKVVL